MNNGDVKREFEMLSKDKYSFSDRFVADWKNLSLNEPAFASNIPLFPGGPRGVYYLRYETDVLEVQGSLEETLKGAFQNAFQLLLQHYNKAYTDSELQTYADLYYENASPISCVYRFNYRGFSNMEVFIRIGKGFIDSLSDSPPKPKDADIVAKYDPWGSVNWEQLEGQIQSHGSYLSNNDYHALYKGSSVDLQKESKYLRKYRKSLQSHLNRNEFDGGVVEVGLITSSLETAFVSDQDGLLKRGQMEIVPDIQIHSELTLRNAAHPKIVMDALDQPATPETERLKEAYPFLEVESIDRSPSEDSENPLKNVKIGGISIEQSLESILKLCQLINQYGANGVRDLIIRTEKEILEEEALAKSDELLQKIDAKVNEEDIFVGNEILDIKNLDEMRFSMTDDIEDIYDQVLNRVSIRRLIELVLECLGVGALDELFLCLLQFETLTIPLPDDLNVPDIFGFLSDLLRKALMTIISRILSALLNRIFQELRNCIKQDIKDVVPKASDRLFDPNTTEARDIGESADLTGKGIQQDKFGELLDDLSVALTFQEICDLFRGKADSKTLEVVEKIIESKYPSIGQRLETRARIENCFEMLGEEAIEILNDFCKQRFGVDADRAGEYLCPGEGIRSDLKKDILSKKNLSEEQVEELLQCERERDKEKEKFFKEMMEKDAPLEDMVFGDKSPEQFLMESQPPATEDGPKVKVFSDQMDAVIASISQTYLGSVEQIVSRVSGDQFNQSLKSPFPTEADVTIREDFLEIRGSQGKQIAFREGSAGTSIVEDGSEILQEVSTTQDIIPDVRGRFMTGIQDALLLNNQSAFSQGQNNFLMGDAFDAFTDQFFEEILDEVNNAYADSQAEKDVEVFDDEALMRTAAPGNKRLKSFAKESFMNKEKESRNSRQESIATSKEVLSLLWLRYRLLRFSLLTFPFDNFKSFETESEFTKSRRIEEMLEDNKRYAEQIKDTDYDDASKVISDYKQISAFEGILDFDQDPVRLLIFGHQEQEPIYSPLGGRGDDYRKRLGVKKNNPQSDFLLEKFLKLNLQDGTSKVYGYPENVKGIKTIVKDLQPTPSTQLQSNNQPGGSDQGNNQQNPFVSEANKEPKGSNAFVEVSETGDADDDTDSKKNQSGDPSTQKQTSVVVTSAEVVLRLSIFTPALSNDEFQGTKLAKQENSFYGTVGNIGYNIFPFATHSRDITPLVDLMNITSNSVPDFSTYKKGLKSVVYNKATNVTPQSALLSMMRIYAAEKAKDKLPFTAQLLSVEDSIDESMDAVEEIEKGNNLFQYD